MGECKKIAEAKQFFLRTFALRFSSNELARDVTELVIFWGLAIEGLASFFVVLGRVDIDANAWIVDSYLEYFVVVAGK